MGLINNLVSILQNKSKDYYDKAELTLLESTKTKKARSRAKKDADDAEKLIKNKKSPIKSLLNSILKLTKANEVIDALKGTTKKPKGRYGDSLGINDPSDPSDKNPKTKLGAKLKSYKDPNKLGGLIGLLLAAFPYLVRIFNNIKEKISEVTGWVDENLIQPVKDLMADGEGFFSSVGTVLGDLVDKFQGFVQGMVNKIKNFFVQINNNLVGSKLGNILGLEQKDLISEEVVDDKPEGRFSEVVDLTEKIKPSADIEQSDEAKDKVKAMVKAAVDTTDNSYLGGGKYDKDGTKLSNQSESYCARHTIDAINTQLGEKIPIRNATDYYEDPSLLSDAGFVPVNMDGYSPEVGDVIVEGSAPGHQYGHIQMYRGEGLPSPDGVNRPYVSDFLQRTNNVHGDVQGPKQAWRYVGGGKSIASNNSLPDTNKSGLGGGDSTPSTTQSTSEVTGTVNNFYNTNNESNSSVYIDVNSSVNSQR